MSNVQPLEADNVAELQLGIIGAGFISGFQVIALRQVRGASVAAILRRSAAEALAERCRRWNLGPAVLCDSVAEVVQQSDVVVINCPNYARVEVMESIVRTVQEGHRLKGLICEKPLGRNLMEARRMVELANSIQVPTAYFENQLFMKALQVQLDQLSAVQQQMGPFSLARSSEEHAGPHEAWFWDPRRQGGGVLSDMGCHSIAVGWHLLTPQGEPLTFLRPETVSAEVGLLKWGQAPWRQQLLDRFGVDYSASPAEDFASGIITYRNPSSGQRVKAQFTNSWMFDKQGLRLLMDALGPGYAFEFNTLVSPLSLFIGDAAASNVQDAEKALEKSTAGRGLLAVHANEADLYGYTDENEDALERFAQGRDGRLPWSYGLEITRLVMACYLSAERGRSIDLTSETVLAELESYRPAIQQGLGRDQLS